MAASRRTDRHPPGRVTALVLVGVLWLASTGTASASGRDRGAAAPVSAPVSTSVSTSVSASVMAPNPGVQYGSPVSPLTVVRGFAPGISRYAAGHRGADLAVAPLAPVAAAAGGSVSFAGSVAGRGIVVVTHPDGIRTTYEPVEPLVVAGQSVVRGQRIATELGAHPGCAQTCLHWGARRGDVYLDPLLLLRALGPIRLLPWS